MTQAYTIPSENLEVVQAHVAKLNKRAKRLNQEPVVLDISDARFIEQKRWVQEAGERKYKEVKVKVYDVVVLGSPPKLNGWSLIASIELLEDINIVRAVPGAEVPHKYRKTDSTCEHCTKKRNRKDVFVLVHDDGRTIQVGRQCIADFLGHLSADTVAARCTMLCALSEFLEGNQDYDGEGGGHGKICWEIVDFLTAAQCAINEFGWVSKKTANETYATSTAQTAMNILGGRQECKNSNQKLSVSTKDREQAEKALEWAEKIDENTENDYLMNLLAVSRHGTIDQRSSGIAASIPFAFGRESAQIEARKSAPVSTFQGEVGKREVFTLTIKAMMPLESIYGTSNLHIMADASGNQFKWFSTSKSYEVGSTVTMKATVKKHDEYKGVKGTLLTRCTEVK